MTKLQSLLLFALISFSLQDNNCLVYFEHCEINEQSNIEHCKIGRIRSIKDEEEEEICNQCENNYVLSHDKKTCILLEKPIEHCIYHFNYSDGTIICEICEEGYRATNGDKNCTKYEKQIDHCTYEYYKYKEELICDECEDEYIL